MLKKISDACVLDWIHVSFTAVWVWEDVRSSRRFRCRKIFQTQVYAHGYIR